jgi:uncharacterized membrane protein YhfC
MGCRPLSNGWVISMIFRQYSRWVYMAFIETRFPKLASPARFGCHDGYLRVWRICFLWIAGIVADKIFFIYSYRASFP